MQAHASNGAHFYTHTTSTTCKHGGCTDVQT